MLKRTNEWRDAMDGWMDQVSRPPFPALLTNFWFLRKNSSCLRFQENVRGLFHIKIMLGEQNNIVWTPNSKLLLSLMIRARALSELNPIKDHCTSDMKLQSFLLLLAWLKSSALPYQRFAGDQNQIKTYKLQPQLSGLSRQYLHSRPSEEDKKKRFEDK